MRVVLLQQLSFDHLIGTCEKCLEARPPECLGGLAMIANSSTSLQHTHTRAKTDQGKKRGEPMAIGRGSGAFCGKARQITPGYCWRTPKCRNLRIPHAFLEGQKAGKTSPRKSTPRTLK